MSVESAHGESAVTMQNITRLASSGLASPTLLDPLPPQHHLSSILRSSSTNSIRGRPSLNSSPLDARHAPRVGHHSRSGSAVAADAEEPSSPRASRHSSSSPTMSDLAHSPGSILVQRPARKAPEGTLLAVQNFQDKLTQMIENQPVSPYAGSPSAGESAGPHLDVTPKKSRFDTRQAPRGGGPSTNSDSELTSAVVSPSPPRLAMHRVASPTIFAAPAAPRLRPWSTADATTRAADNRTPTPGISSVPTTPAPEVSVSTLSLLQQRTSANQMYLFAPGGAPTPPQQGGLLSASPASPAVVAPVPMPPSPTPLLSDLAELQDDAHNGRHWIGAPSVVAREDAVDDAALVSPLHSVEEKLHMTSEEPDLPDDHVTWMQYALSKPIPRRPIRRLKHSALSLLLPMVLVPFCLCVVLLGLHFWALRSQIDQAGILYDPMVGRMRMPNFAFMMAVLLCFLVAAAVLVALAYYVVWRMHLLPFIRTMEIAEAVAHAYCDHRALLDDDVWQLKREVLHRRPTFWFEWYANMVMAAIVHANRPLLVLFAYTDLYRLEQMVVTARARLQRPAHAAIEFLYGPASASVLDGGNHARAAEVARFFATRPAQAAPSAAPGSASLTGDTAFSPSMTRSDSPGYVHSPLQAAALSASPGQPLTLTESQGGTYYANDAIQLSATYRRDESPAPVPSVLGDSVSRRTLQRQASGLSPARAAIMSAGRRTSGGGGAPGEEEEWRDIPNLLYANSAMRSPSVAFRQSASPSSYFDRDVQPEESITLGASRFFENTTSNLLFQPVDSQQHVSFLVCRLFLPPVGQTADATTRKELAAELEEVTSQFYRSLFSVAAITNGIVCDYQLDSALLTFNAFTPLTQVQLMPRATEAAAMLSEELQDIFHARPHIRWGIVLHLGGAIVNTGGDGTATYIASPEIALAYSAVKLCARLQVPAISFLYQEPNEYFHWTCVDMVERDEMGGYVYAMQPTRWVTDVQSSALEEAATSQRFIWLFQGAPEKVLQDTSNAQSQQADRALTIARSLLYSVHHGARGSGPKSGYQRLFETWTVPEEDAAKKTVGEAMRLVTSLKPRSPRTARPVVRSRATSIIDAALPRPPRPRSVSLLSSASMPRAGMMNTPLQHSADYSSPSEGRELTALVTFPRARSRSATLLGMESATGATLPLSATGGNHSASFLPSMPLPDEVSGSDFRLFSPPNIIATVENRALTPSDVHHRGGTHSTPLRTGSYGAPGTSSDDDENSWVPVTQNTTNVTKPHAETPLQSTSEGFSFSSGTSLGLMTVPPLNLGNLAEVVPTDPLQTSFSVNAASSSRFGGTRRTSTTTFLRRPSSTVFESSVRNTVEFRPVIVFPKRDDNKSEDKGSPLSADGSTPIPLPPVTSVPSMTSASNGTSHSSGDVSAASSSVDHTIVVGEEIGQGTAGRVVYKGMFPRTNRMVAIKQVPLPESSTVTEATQVEIDLLAKLRHKSVVGYIGSCIQAPYLYIVMEFVAGGPMQKILDTFGFLPIPVLRRYMRHMLDALSFVHSNGVVHRDISANNVLVTTDGLCKLTDFGGAMENIVALNDEQDSKTPSLSVSSYDSDDPIRRLARHNREDVSDALDLISSSQSSLSDFDENLFRTSAIRVRGNNNTKEKQVFGTPLYMSPQACMGDVHPKNDIWSLGILFCQCASGAYPWDDTQLCDREEFISQIANGTLRPHIPLYAMNSDMVDFAEQCLQQDINKRWDAKQLLKHSFIIGRGSSVV